MESFGLLDSLKLEIIGQLKNGESSFGSALCCTLKILKTNWSLQTNSKPKLNNHIYICIIFDVQLAKEYSAGLLV